MGGYKIVKFVNVFSLESFPLYKYMQNNYCNPVAHAPRGQKKTPQQGSSKVQWRQKITIQLELYRAHTLRAAAWT